ncbi:hypothetical protein AALP_AA8G282500 [Arabis alpina]|uniref:Uncharacterized protein n=1 Tax=Arabis alpina TaxID=50452 RepID=A0A087GA01_ARAAL|nr:hypothetical protein AALP_AA8G282500 [Arabis alpina]
MFFSSSSIGSRVINMVILDPVKWSRYKYGRRKQKGSWYKIS